MKIIRLFINYLKEWLLILLWFVNAKFKKDKHKEYEIVALRMQLAYYKEQVEKKNLPKARTSIVYKQFWVLMSKYYEKWKELPKLTTPKTVLNWHETTFKKYWWKTFLKNHKDIWAMDFFVVPTLTFKMLYVLIIINHDTRKIEHFGVTSNPNTPWLKQQFREATPYEHKPKYLIHDNNPVFLSKDFEGFLDSSQIKSKRTAYRSPWQNGIGERVIGSIRRELTDHIIPINELHLHRLMKEYVDNYYNTNRTHQGIACKTLVPSPIYAESKFSESEMIPKEILGDLYHTYRKVA